MTRGTTPIEYAGPHVDRGTRLTFLVGSALVAAAFAVGYLGAMAGSVTRLWADGGWPQVMADPLTGDVFEDGVDFGVFCEAVSAVLLAAIVTAACFAVGPRRGLRVRPSTMVVATLSGVAVTTIRWTLWHHGPRWLAGITPDAELLAIGLVCATLGTGLAVLRSRTCDG